MSAATGESRLGRVVVAVGLGAVGFGLASVALRETFGFSLSYTFVTMVGVLAVAQGIRAVSGRRRGDTVETETGDPELRYLVPTPGDDFDDEVTGAGGWSLSSVSKQRDIRDRLHRTAVDALVTYGNYSAEDAVARIEAGTWTSDPVAASFLSDTAPAPPLRARLRQAIRRESRFHYRVARTVDAIQRVQEEAR